MFYLYGSEDYYNRIDERELNDLILEKITSDYTFENLVATNEVKNELNLFIKEHKAADLLRSYELPVANKILLYGPSVHVRYYKKRWRSESIFLISAKAKRNCISIVLQTKSINFRRANEKKNRLKLLTS